MIESIERYENTCLLCISVHIKTVINILVSINFLTHYTRKMGFFNCDDYGEKRFVLLVDRTGSKKGSGSQKFDLMWTVWCAVHFTDRIPVNDFTLYIMRCCKPIHMISVVTFINSFGILM